MRILFILCFFQICLIRPAKACEEASIVRLFPLGISQKKVYFLKISLQRLGLGGNTSKDIFETKPPSKEKLVYFGPGGPLGWSGKITILYMNQKGSWEKLSSFEKSLSAYACAGKGCVAGIRKSFWKKLVWVGKKDLGHRLKTKLVPLRVEGRECSYVKKCGVFQVLDLPKKNDEMPKSGLWFWKNGKKTSFVIDHRFGYEGAPPDYIFYVRRFSVWKKVFYLLTLDSVLDTERNIGKKKIGQMKKCFDCIPVHPIEFHGEYGDIFFSDKLGLKSFALQ